MSSKNILVSIIVPIYNMSSQIDSCVASLLKQTYKFTEIILVDDGSTDSTLIKCKALEKKYNNIRVIHTINQGAGPARNRGIEDSKGKYLYFPDADDYLKPDAIEILLNIAEKGQSDIIVFGYNCTDQNGNILKTKRYKNEVFDGNYVRENYSKFYLTENGNRIQGAPWNKLFRADIVKDYKIQYPQLRRHQDEAFIARYMCYVKKVVFIENILYTYKLNLQRNEWEKYPVDYIDAVNGLYEERKKNILIWNDLDVTTHNMVYEEYIYFTIKAIELSFSPKFNFDRAKRINWMTRVLNESDFKKIKTPKDLHLYQRIVKYLIQKNQIQMAYELIHFKSSVQKYMISKNT